MPSKGKKTSKTLSSSPSPATPTVINGDVHREFLLAAAAKYPSLIPNPDHTFFGTITGFDSSHSRENTVVYLSHSAMTSLSFRPGSLVSVCLIPLENQLEVGYDCSNEHNAGKYFAIATIRPSSKVVKGAYISWGLSCSMGFPSIGRSIFISHLSTTFCRNKCDVLHLRLISSKIVGESGLSDDFVTSLAIEDDKSKDLVQVLAARWLYGRHLLKGNIVGVPNCGRLCMFKVEDDESSLGLCALSINRATKVEILSDNGLLDSNVGGPNEDHEVENYDEVALGGLSKEFTELIEMFPSSFDEDKSYQSYKGVLLCGPPGTGKTSLAHLCAKQAGARLFTINGPEIISPYNGESEQEIHNIFNSAKKSAPSVVFIDEFDSIAPARQAGNAGISHRTVAALIDSMNKIGRNDRVLLMAATNRPDSIDPALRRAGRLDKEIKIGVSSQEQRLDILMTLMRNMYHCLSETEVESLAFETHGFVGADLAGLCNEAAINAFRRYINSKGKASSFNGNVNAMSSLPDSHSKLELAAVSEDIKEVEEDLVVRFEDFEMANLETRPSAMRDVMLEVPKVRWADIGGQSEVKKKLMQVVQWLQMPQEDSYVMPRSVLLMGPPGCSKTLMARAVASEAKLNFMAVKGPELYNKYVGESQKAVNRLFQKARVNSPAVIFFDEFDGLAGTRGDEGDSVGNNVVSQLLHETDDLSAVIVIAATNRPDKIDPALIDRFDRVLDVQPPDEMDREVIFKIHTKNKPCAPDVNFKELAVLTHGYTGADIKQVCSEAAHFALEEDYDVRYVSMRHFKSAIDEVQPS